MRTACLAALLLTTAACSPPGPWEFPIGLYGVQDDLHLAEIRKQGFTAVQTDLSEPAQVLELARACAKHELGLMVHPGKIRTSTYTARQFSGIWWFLKDEPDVHGMSGEQLAALDREVRRWAPGMRTTFVVGDGRKAKDYPRGGDAIMVDWYPVPHLPLESTGRHVRWTVKAAEGRRAWAVLQAMDWRHYRQGNPNKPRIGRFPTLHEIRFMTYHSILEGAQGIWYFAFRRPDGQDLADLTELWFPVTWVTREISALRPILLRGDEHPPGLKLAENVKARRWRYRLRDYVVLANLSSRPAPFPEELLVKRWRPLFETRRDVRRLLKEEEGKFFLKPHQVLVFESRLNLS